MGVEGQDDEEEENEEKNEEERKHVIKGNKEGGRKIMKTEERELRINTIDER